MKSAIRHATSAELDQSWGFSSHLPANSNWLTCLKDPGSLTKKHALSDYHHMTFEQKHWSLSASVCEDSAGNKQQGRRGWTEALNNYTEVIINDSGFMCQFSFLWGKRIIRSGRKEVAAAVNESRSGDNGRAEQEAAPALSDPVSQTWQLGSRVISPQSPGSHRCVCFLPDNCPQEEGVGGFNCHLESELTLRCWEVLQLKVSADRRAEEAHFIWASSWGGCTVSKVSSKHRRSGQKHADMFIRPICLR